MQASYRGLCPNRRKPRGSELGIVSHRPEFKVLLNKTMAFCKKALTLSLILHPPNYHLEPFRVMIIQVRKWQKWLHFTSTEASFSLLQAFSHTGACPGFTESLTSSWVSGSCTRSYTLRLISFHPTSLAKGPQKGRKVSCLRQGSL